MRVHEAAATAELEKRQQRRDLGRIGRAHRAQADRDRQGSRHRTRQDGGRSLEGRWRLVQPRRCLDVGDRPQPGRHRRLAHRRQQGAPQARLRSRCRSLHHLRAFERRALLAWRARARSARPGSISGSLSSPAAPASPSASAARRAPCARCCVTRPRRSSSSSAARTRRHGRIAWNGQCVLRHAGADADRQGGDRGLADVARIRRRPRSVHRPHRPGQDLFRGLRLSPQGRANRRLRQARFAGPLLLQRQRHAGDADRRRRRRHRAHGLCLLEPWSRAARFQHRGARPDLDHRQRKSACHRLLAGRGWKIVPKAGARLEK